VFLGVLVDFRILGLAFYIQLLVKLNSLEKLDLLYNA